MRKLTQVDANEIVRLHGIWRNGEDGGVRANFSGYDLSWLDLCNADLSYANLSYANLSDANLSDANLRDANLRYADLCNANLRCANLRGADLRYADLRYADLRCANLGGANLRYANLSGVYLSGANLRCANLSDANLSGADLTGVYLHDAIGNGREIITIQTSVYHINYTSTEIQIGCKKHTIEKWKNFTDEQIEEMDGGSALYFWRRYKDFIFMAIELSPATPTKPIQD